MPARGPMSAAFQSTPDLKQYEAVKPQHPLDERNPAKSATAARSLRMDFSEADMIDDDELNDILWRAIRHTDPPVPVRSLLPANSPCLTFTCASYGTCISRSIRT